MDVVTLTRFFGLITVINFGFMILTLVMMTVAKNFAISVHRKFFNLTNEQFELVFYQYLAAFKIVVIVFNLVPYVALRLLGT